MKSKHSNKVRIIYLKQTPQQRNIYQKRLSPENIQIQDQNSRYSKANKINHTSIAYLSSILQDERQNTEKTLVQPFDSFEPSARQNDKIQMFRRSAKKSNRYLSCLLQLPQNMQQNHSKTEIIEKILQKKKMMPIDKIRQRKKNITFSLKNKKELNEDFHEFVTKQAKIFKPQVQKTLLDKQTIVFQKRKYTDKKFANLRNEAQKQKRIRQDFQALQENLIIPTLSNKKITLEPREPGYAIAFKRLSSDIPRLNRFQWSRLDDNSYQLVKS